MLNAIEHTRQLVEIRQTQYAAAENAETLARKRYNGGIASCLELLDSERVPCSVELSLDQTRQELMNIYVTLYKSLGGGW